jgi:hypothetical protein
MCASFVVRYHKFRKGLVQPTLYCFFGRCSLLFEEEDVEDDEGWDEEGDDW